MKSDSYACNYITFSFLIKNYSITRRGQRVEARAPLPLIDKKIEEIMNLLNTICPDDMKRKLHATTLFLRKKTLYPRLQVITFKVLGK